MLTLLLVCAFTFIAQKFYFQERDSHREICNLFWTFFGKNIHCLLILCRWGQVLAWWLFFLPQVVQNRLIWGIGSRHKTSNKIKISNRFCIFVCGCSAAPLTSYAPPCVSAPPCNLTLGRTVPLFQAFGEIWAGLLSDTNYYLQQSTSAITVSSPKGPAEQYKQPPFLGEVYIPKQEPLVGCQFKIELHSMAVVCWHKAWADRNTTCCSSKPV